MASVDDPTRLDEDETSRQREKVFFAIGRSVFLYQQIEIFIKAQLPFSKSAGEKVIDPFAEMTRLLKSRATLAPLFDRLKETGKYDDPEAFAMYLEQVVKNRNELVHSFLQLPFGNLSTATFCVEALEYLEMRHTYALPLVQLLGANLAVILEFLVVRDGNEEEQKKTFEMLSATFGRRLT